MESWSVISTILSVLLGGTNILQFIFYKSEKKKKQAEVIAMELTNKEKSNELDQGRTDYFVERIDTLQKDYLSMFEIVQGKCNEVAELKVEITYLKGLRCYNTTCTNRLRKKEEESITD